MSTARLPKEAYLRLRQHKVTKNKKKYDRKNKEWKNER